MSGSYLQPGIMLVFKDDDTEMKHRQACIDNPECTNASLAIVSASELV